MKIRGFAAAGQATTPVPTAFLADEVPDAPADYVKVYLYGLYLAGLDVPPQPTEVEERLHMKASEIEDAISYWERRGAVRVRSDGTVCYRMGEPEFEQEKEKEKQQFPYVAFNLQVSEAMGRDPSATELKEIYAWLETYSFPQDVAIMLIRHCIDRKGTRIHINYMAKVAAAWADRGVDSVDKAQQEIEAHRARTSGARQVMQRMGVRDRQPGQTEMELYDKWTAEYGFTHEGIMYAMRDIEFNMSTPFRYLDGVLRNLHEKGAHTAQEVQQVQDARTSEADEVKEVLRMLGYKTTISRESLDTYRSWREQGHDANIILLACAQATRYENRRMEHATQILNEWTSSGLTDEQQIRDMLAEQATLECQIQEMYDTAGIDRDIRDADVKMFRSYMQQYNMDYDVLMYAASLSAVGKNPLQYMRGLLNRWAKAQVTNIAEARVECENFARQKEQQKKQQYGGGGARGASTGSFAQRPRETRQEADERAARTRQILSERYYGTK